MPIAEAWAAGELTGELTGTPTLRGWVIRDTHSKSGNQPASPLSRRSSVQPALTPTSRHSRMFVIHVLADTGECRSQSAQLRDLKA